MAYRSGRHFLQIPGPTNVPDRILRAIDRPTIDHRGPEFQALTLDILDGLKQVFKTAGPYEENIIATFESISEAVLSVNYKLESGASGTCRPPGPSPPGTTPSWGKKRRWKLSTSCATTASRPAPSGRRTGPEVSGPNWGGTFPCLMPSWTGACTRTQRR